MLLLQVWKPLNRSISLLERCCQLHCNISHCPGRISRKETHILAHTHSISEFFFFSGTVRYFTAQIDFKCSSCLRCVIINRSVYYLSLEGSTRLPKTWNQKLPALGSGWRWVALWLPAPSWVLWAARGAEGPQPHLPLERGSPIFKFSFTMKDHSSRPHWCMTTSVIN